MVQLEAAVTVAVLVVAAVVASWLLVEGKMYLLPASAVHTSVDKQNVHVTGTKGCEAGWGGGGRKDYQHF